MKIFSGRVVRGLCKYGVTGCQNGKISRANNMASRNVSRGIDAFWRQAITVAYLSRGVNAPRWRRAKSLQHLNGGTGVDQHGGVNIFGIFVARLATSRALARSHAPQHRAVSERLRHHGRRLCQQLSVCVVAKNAALIFATRGAIKRRHCAYLQQTQ